MDKAGSERLAREALLRYDLSVASLAFLGQSENTTFQVGSASGERFLLRLHSGVAQAGEAEWRAVPAIESEMMWLEALAQGSPVAAPRPVRGRAGEWVVSGAGPPCSLLRWVEGERLAGRPTPGLARQLGVLMAQLHEHACGWTPPPGFSRPAYDAERLGSSLRWFEASMPSGMISDGDRQAFREGAGRVQQLMRALPRTRESWGVIHGDLHDGNLVAHGGGIRPIDFSRCGWGFYLWDIGVALGFLEAELRCGFFDGYAQARELPQGYQEIVEAFFVGAIVANFAFLSASPAEHEGLSRSIPPIARLILGPHSRGESFLFER